jgi:hypothetical protein
MTETTEEEIVQFDRLVAKAAILHPMAWCCKNTWYRFTASLRGRECLNCPDFVMKGGVCDPI